MPSLWFVVPAAGRAKLAGICLRQLRRTCDALTAEGITASAVVIADDQNLRTAKQLGFATVRRNNAFLSRKFNDGIQLACDQRFNPRPADYVVPCGSDDWVDHRILRDLPEPDSVRAFQTAAFVDETGQMIVSRHIDYQGGVGIRVYPREMMGRCGYRPADEDRTRACDTSILVNVSKTYGGRGPRIVYGDQHEFQIVDWKTSGEQLNAYDDVVRRFRGTKPADPFTTLLGVFPKDALDEMRRHYRTASRRRLVAA